MSTEPLWHWYTEQVDPNERHSFAFTAVHYFGRTQIQAAEIVETVNYGKMLIIGGRTQSAQADEAIYHESLVHPALIAHPEPRTVLIIGGGEGATLREVLRHRTVQRAVMVDIDGELVEICQKHLPEWHEGAFADPRAELVIADGWDYVAQAGPRFDVIIVDVCDVLEQGPALRLYTRRFYEMLRDRLNPGGLVAIQAMELSTEEYKDHLEVRGELARVFPLVRSYATYIPSFWSAWGFIVASAGADPGALDRVTVNARLAERALDGQPPLIDQLDFYDGETHDGLFALSRGVRQLLVGGTAGAAAGETLA